MTRPHMPHIFTLHFAIYPCALPFRLLGLR
jgi:hypothetical protein